MARTLAITYGSITVGAGATQTSYILTDKYSINLGYESVSVECEVIVTNSTRATFLTHEAALVAEFRKPDQALTISLGGTNRHVYDPSDNSGFLTRATATKAGSVEDTQNSSRWILRVDARLPADLTGRSGRQTAKVEVSQGDSERKTARFAGTYTALSANSATAQYAAAAQTWIDAQLTSLGGTWNRVSKRYDYDDQDKIASFSEEYEQILLEEGVGSTDVSSLVNQQLVIRRRTFSEARASGYNAQPLQFTQARYSVAVLSSVSTNLRSLYTSTIRPHLLNQIRRVLDSGTLVVTREAPEFDAANNRVAVQLDVAVDPGAEWLRLSIASADSIDNGKILLPVWNGNPYSRRQYQGPATHVKRVTIRAVARKGKIGRHVLGQALEIEGFELLGEERTQDRQDIGVPGDTFSLEEVTQVYTYSRADDPTTQTGTRERGSAATGGSAQNVNNYGLQK